MEEAVAYVLAIVLIALVFDFINGFHDSANSIATVVSTRGAQPRRRGLLGRVLQFHRGVRRGDGGGEDHRQGAA